MSNEYGALLIEAISGGGYVVHERNPIPGSFCATIFACSSKDELLKFVGTALVTTDVAHASTTCGAARE